MININEEIVDKLLYRLKVGTILGNIIERKELKIGQKIYIEWNNQKSKVIIDNIVKVKDGCYNLFVSLL